MNDTLITETRACGKCRHFKLNQGANVLGMCEKLLMHVTKKMLVTYKKEIGTCFQYKKTF